MTFVIFVSPNSCRQIKLPQPFFILLLFAFLWSTLSLSFTCLIACNEFLIQTRIDLLMLAQNGQWGLCWKALITSGAWQQLSPTSFYLKKCHCANGGHISTLSSPVPSAGRQHWVSIKKKKRKEKSLEVSSESILGGGKICHVNTRSILSNPKLITSPVLSFTAAA